MSFPCLRSVVFANLSDTDNRLQVEKRTISIIHRRVRTAPEIIRAALNDRLQFLDKYLILRIIDEYPRAVSLLVGAANARCGRGVGTLPGRSIATPLVVLYGTAIIRKEVCADHQP